MKESAHCAGEADPGRAGSQSPVGGCRRSPAALRSAVPEARSADKPAALTLIGHSWSRVSRWWTRVGVKWC